MFAARPRDPQLETGGVNMLDLCRLRPGQAGKAAGIGQQCVVVVPMVCMIVRVAPSAAGSPASAALTSVSTWSAASGTTPTGRYGTKVAAAVSVCSARSGAYVLHPPIRKQAFQRAGPRQGAAQTLGRAATLNQRKRQRFEQRRVGITIQGR